MRALMVFMCLLALGCLAQKPHPCTSPPLMTGALTVSCQNERLWANAKYIYDALGQRIRLKEIGNFDNKTFTYDALLLYRQGIMYQIDEKGRHCVKQPIKEDFHPMAIPKNASLVGQAILGSSSGPGQGVLVNTWWGTIPNGGKYMSTVTEFGCIPISTFYQTTDFGWVMTSLFNNIIGISDPDQLNPPDFCEGVEMMYKGGPASFFSLFQQIE